YHSDPRLPRPCQHCDHQSVRHDQLADEAGSSREVLDTVRARANPPSPMDAQARSARVPRIRLMAIDALFGVRFDCCSVISRLRATSLWIIGDSGQCALSMAQHKAHARRKFYDLFKATQSPLAQE